MPKKGDQITCECGYETLFACDDEGKGTYRYVLFGQELFIGRKLYCDKCIKKILKENKYLKNKVKRLEMSIGEENNG